MIKCTRCKTIKADAKFNNSKSRKSGKRAHCQDCEREQARDYYKNNPAGYKRRASDWQKKLRAHLREVIEEIRQENGCALCPETDPCCLDFHHVKKGRPVTRSTHSYSVFEREVSKCVMICANCHRKVHAGKSSLKGIKTLKIKVPRMK